jgi:hypothetical protein
VLLLLIFTVLVFVPGWVKLFIPAACGHCRYWFYLSDETDTPACWDGLTRRDITRARVKARRNRAKAKVPPGGRFDPIEAVPLTSWRNPRSRNYTSPPSSNVLRVCRAIRFLVSLGVLLLLASLAVVPAMAMNDAASTAHQLRDSSAFVNYGAAEVQHAQREQLAALRLQTYEPRALAKQFEHGINQHLPDRVAHQIDTSRYVTDEVSGLVIDRPPGITSTQHKAFVDMLRERAPTSVAYSLDDLSGYTGIEPPLRIVLDTTAPIQIPARRNWSKAESDIIDEKCRELLDGKHPVCQRLVHSDYACNPLLAIKRAPDGTWSDQRFCINFIPINKHTAPDRYSAHRADELFARVVNAKYLTALDLRSGYHQIPMDHDSVAKTAFWWSTATVSPNLLAYQRMPFGLKNAPAKFQRVMDTELARGGCSDFAFAYIDDLIIASDSWEEHIEHVARVLKTLEACNLKIHPQKSVFATNVVEYLGHNVVGQYGLTMNDAKIQAIKALPNPSNVPELRSILGFMAYYRHFIPGYSSLTAPLNRLLQKGVPFNWGPEQRAAYATLKDLMTEPGRVLRAINYDKELILHTDWSCYGIGAVLGQLDEDGNEYLCACVSRSLNKHERNYPSYKGELLALAWAVRSFRQHLHGTHFRLVTDHQPLKWLMEARDLNGQYARWQMMLQEYDFDIEHRAGAKHTNADVLSRFPQSRSNDNTGTQLDSDVAAYCGVWTPAPAARKMREAPVGRPKGPTIDDLAPKFNEVFHQGNVHVDQYHYADGYMRSDNTMYSSDTANCDTDHIVAAIEHAASLATPRMSDAIRHAVSSIPIGRHSDNPLTAASAIDNSPVGNDFYGAAHEGLSVLEMCGGICASLETLLRAGIPVKQYFYCDIDPVARRVAQFRMANMSALYPDLFPPSAWGEAFVLPQDITKITEHHLSRHGLFDQTHPWLIAAGWPCQDYSAAGLGTIGRRAALLHDVTRIITMMQNRHSDHPVGYIMENVAMQHNFRHNHIKYPVFDQVVAQLGQPVTFDAAQAGSYAHRLRNYWTNLAQPDLIQMVLDQLEVPREHVVNDLLGPNRTTYPVQHGERTISNRQYNVAGQPREVLPTLMSFPNSRAFRAKRQGCIFDATRNAFEEPTAEERELIMGFEPSSTAAPGVSERERRSLLGQAIDLNALTALWLTSVTIRRRTAGLPLPVNACLPDPIREVNATTVGCPWDDDHNCEPIGAAVHDVRFDIWEDTPTIRFIREQSLPLDPSESSRIRKRALKFRWFNNRLFKVVLDKLSNSPAYRLVPPMQDRDSLILQTHKGLGHIGEKRTIAAIATEYWWHGMTLDIRRVISTCKICKRVGVRPPAATQEMQTEPHDYGLFYRWGLDYVGELTESRHGNKYALICIDYLSKWIEVIPVPKADSATTTRLVLLHLIARFGTPAEIVCDNGPPFQGEFMKFCAERRIRMRFITPGVPRSNGLAERAVQTVKYALRKNAAESHHALDWCSHGLANILLGYRITTQASTQLSPAQILFAQNPAVNADHYAREMGSIEYLDDDIEKITKQLMFRAEIAAKLGAQVAENLRLAHVRNAERFKKLRSGTYIPKVYMFRPGDFVFPMHEEDKIPGGALGIRAKPEILKVIEVRRTGVLIIENQAGERSELHKEQCAPCLLPNVEGTTHPGLKSPPAKLPCIKCGDHRKAAVMLLCDHCDAPWHTYCLDPPLTSVPEGNWLCPHCVNAGVTDTHVRIRQEKFIPSPVDRPRLELPSPRRQANAKALMDEWHGAVVVRQRPGSDPVHGRVIYQGILESKWFKIYWDNGTESEHMAGIFRHLGRVDETNAPAGVMHKPDPTTVFVLVSAHAPEASQLQVNWSVRTTQDLMQRMQQLLPGSHDESEVRQILRSFNKRPRTELVKAQPKVPQSAVAALLSTLDFRQCRTVLDPWAGQPMVRTHFRPAGSNLIVNDPWGPADLHLEPIEPHLYTSVIAKTDLDAVVTCPPVMMADVALVTAFYHVRQCVCMYVPVSWVSLASAPRMGIITKHMHHGTFLGITTVSDPTHCWVCFFTTPTAYYGMVRAHIAHTTGWHTVHV